MKKTDFIRLCCVSEGGEEEVNIAQMSETVKVINALTGGRLYTEIEAMTEEEATERFEKLKTS